MDILIIEDDRDIRESLTELLEMEGYRISSATNGKEGLEHLRTTKDLPGLILLDLNMPVMTGQELLVALKAEDENLRKIPVFVMTAVPDAVVSGVAGFLKKPLEIDLLISALGRMQMLD